MITFFLMTFLASFMIFICINFLTGTFRVCNTNKEIINGADILLLKGQNEISTFKLKEIIQGNENVKNYEQTKFLMATMKHRKKGKTRWTDYNFAVSSYDDEREIQKASIDMSSFSGNDIVLPISLSTAYKIGDTIILKIGDNTYDFRVAAFNEDYIWSSPMNMGTYWCYISEKMYNQIEFECSSYAVPYYIIKLQMSDKALKNNVSDDNEADAIYSEYNLWVQNYQSTQMVIETLC